MLELRLLGQFDVRLDAVSIHIPSRPAQSLLAYLALTAGIAHRRERLAGLLWPDAEEDSARSSLRQGLWRIRKAVEKSLPAGTQYVLADDLSIAFNPTSAYWLDALVLEGGSDGVESLGALKESLVVYRGELLPGFYDDWALRERERLEGVFERRMSALLDRLVEQREWPAVLEWAERWIAVGHVPEPAYRALMLAHAERGDRARIASVYQRCRELLFEELGAQPSDQTRQLFERLSRGERVLPSDDKPRSALASATNTDEQLAPGDAPFQGLEAFDEPDSERFFGREDVTARLLERLLAEPFLAVVGASGSGKSSIVRAGVVAALRHSVGDGEWVIHVLTPSTHPLAALAETLTRNADSTSAANLLRDVSADPRSLTFFLQRNLLTGQHALLVVDQFEELFTLCHDAFEREAFIDNLLGAADAGASVLIALRADFYAHCAEYLDLRRAIADHQEYIGPMDADEVRRAIELPAKRADWSLQAGLVELLLRDVGGEPGALPLLSHALLETWRRRRGRALTLQAYAESGGVRGAIAQTAESVLHERLSANQRGIARRIFLRLTQLGEGTQDTRRRARLDELVPRPEEAVAVQAVVQVLADARLITLGEDTVEVAHEALIREWPTLRAWLDEDRDGLRLHQQLAEAAQEWERLRHDPDMLFRGARLAQAREWADAHSGELIGVERTFLEAGGARAEREATEREAQRQRELEAAHRTAEAERQRAESQAQRAEEQRHAARRLRRRALYLTAALVFAIGMAGLAVLFGDQAQQSAASAQTSARVAFARELAAAAVSSLDTDPERSVLLSLQAVEAARSSATAALRETQEALRRALAASRIQMTLRGHTAGVFSTAFSPDGGYIASIDQGGVAKVWDAVKGGERLSLETGTHGNYATGGGIAFSPDGVTLATIQRNRTVRLWDVNSGAVRLDFPEQPGSEKNVGGPVLAIAFSPDGARLATGATDGSARVWDLTAGTEVERFGSPAGPVFAVAFSPDGTRLATGGYDDNTAHIWDLASGADLLTLKGHSEPIQSIAFGPDGTEIATASNDTTIRVSDTSSGQLRLVLYGHVSHVAGLAFDPSGTRLLSASEDGNAKVWDVRTGRAILTLAGHASGVLGAAWSPDGTRVATASRDTTIRVWDVSGTGGGEGPTLVGHAGKVVDVVFSPDGRYLATAGDDRTARVWDARTGQSLRTLTGHEADVNSVAFSPDGTQIATASSDGTARVWDAATGASRLSVTNNPEPGTGLGGVIWIDGARKLAVAARGSKIGVWDTATGQLDLRVEFPSLQVQRLALSPDGVRLASVGADGHVVVWDSVSGATLLDLDSQTTLTNGVAFSPDGRLLASTGNDALVRLWDAQTGRELVARSGHAGGTFGVAFSPDGQHLASSSVDRTVKIWSVVGGSLAPDEPLTLAGHAAAVYRVAWSPDGKRLATASRDGTSRIYVTELDDLLALARGRVTRSLTTEECTKYLHEEQCPE